MRLWITALLLLGAGACGAPPTNNAPAAPHAATTAPVDDLAMTGIVWHDWSPAAFDQAKREHKLVLLHLGAGWCHWCHVMEHVTYRDPAVVALINAHYVAIHVDQDSRPDLSNRYEDYGWPATIFFDAGGHELVKWQGYIPPERMRVLLQATVDDPTPGPSIRAAVVATGGAGELAAGHQARLVKRLDGLYDTTRAGSGSGDKYLDADALEFEMLQATGGDAVAGRRARATLAAARKLIDPVWGGIDQYSTDGDWDHPHFEKIMQFQADGIRTYALAYMLWHDDADLRSAKAIAGFLRTFLRSPTGAFYTSQDADVIPGQHSADYFALDDAARRKIGVPRIDTHIYARENGWAARALVALYAATADKEYLDEARQAVDWIAAHRQLAGGGFRHDQVDAAGPYLGDSLAMAQAYLALYEATAQLADLTAAQNAMNFIDEHFTGTQPGYLTAEQVGLLPSTPQFDENVGVARTANLLYQYTGVDRYQQMADHAMRFITAPAITDAHAPAPTLLAADELGRDPVHVTIVGALDDPDAAALHAAALGTGVVFMRLDWWDPHAGPPVRSDVDYPSLSKPAAFLCANGACSSPVMDPQRLVQLVHERGRPPRSATGE